MLHVRRCGVARWKASNPLFPAATVAGVRARSYSFYVAKKNLSLIDVGRFWLTSSCSQSVKNTRREGGRGKLLRVVDNPLPPHARTHHQRLPTPPPPPGGSRGHRKVHWGALQAATSARPINRWYGWLFKLPTANCQNFFRTGTGAGGLWGAMRVV